MTKRNRNLAIASAVLLFLLYFHQFIFFSHWQTFTVIQNDAPRYCSTGGLQRYGLMREQGRSSVPEKAYFGYCGAIVTDRGTYMLPDDAYRLSLHQPRANLHDRLIEGCKFEVLIVGYGGKFRHGRKLRVPLRQKIAWIWSDLGCDD